MDDFSVIENFLDVLEREIDKAVMEGERELRVPYLFRSVNALIFIERLFYNEDGTPNGNIEAISEENQPLIERLPMLIDRLLDKE